MDKILQFVYKVYKKVRPPKRLYRYGTTGLKYFDDRTRKEKLFDYIDEFFFNWQQNIRYRRAYRKQVFHSFFDYGLGRVVSSNDEIKAKEKEGYVYISDAEADRETARRRRINKQERRQRIEKHFSEGFARIKAGNSHYYQDLQNRTKNG